MANDNEMLISRIKGVAAQPGTPETDADPRNPNAAPRVISFSSRFDRIIGELQSWRNEDHEDKLLLPRSYVIEIIEGVEALRKRGIG